MNLKRKPQQTSYAAMTSAAIEAGLTLVQPLDRQQFLYGVILDFYGRLTTGGGNGASVNAEAPYSVFRRIRVTQNHEWFGDKQRVNRAGASLHKMVDVMTGTAQLATGSLAVGQAAYDIHVQTLVPLCVLGMPERATLATLCDAPRCGSLNIEIDLATGHELIPTGGATTYAWAAYGGGGNPVVNVTLLQVNGLKGTPKTGMWAYLDRLDAITASNAIDNQLGNEIRINGALARLWLKQYVADTASNINAAATMLAPNTPAGSGIDTPQFFVNANPIRQWAQWTQLEGENKSDFQQEAWPAGYGVIDFIEDRDLREVLPAVDYIKAGGKLGIGGAITGIANGQVESGYEVLYPHP
jgi:hypothetical protein